MPQPVIEVERLTKRFGSETAVNDVSFTFERGRIYGIVGRNGSGKTVLLKCILGLMPVTAGRIRILGAPVDSRSLAHVGMIIEAPGFLPGYDAFRNLWMLASIRGRADRERVRESIRLVGLDPHSRKSVGKYSLGMRQRLGIAQAIMEDPDVLLLDEPMNGLDNRGVEDMRALFLRLKEQGKTLLIASHNREDIDLLCDEVYAMDRGAATRVRERRGATMPPGSAGTAALRRGSNGTGQKSPYPG